MSHGGLHGVNIYAKLSLYKLIYTSIGSFQRNMLYPEPFFVILRDSYFRGKVESLLSTYVIVHMHRKWARFLGQIKRFQLSRQGWLNIGLSVHSKISCVVKDFY